MQFKNINEFNLQECERFLNDNPNSERAEEVKSRQKQLMEELSHIDSPEDEVRNQQIRSYEDKMKWIDVAQFDEKQKYRDYSTLVTIIKGIVLAYIFVCISVFYYTHTEHYIYEEYNDEQAAHVTGIEKILLKCHIIECTYWFSDFSPHRGSYYFSEGTGYVFVGICYILFFIIVFLIILFTLFTVSCGKNLGCGKPVFCRNGNFDIE